jgi:hypothetical protein
MRLALFAFILPAVLVAQTPAQTLPPPNGRIAAEFSDLTTIRELRDGRVLLFDRKEERLVVVDFATGTVRDVARKGQGPAEFEFVATLLSLPADTTIAADLTRRWLVLVGDSVVRKFVPEYPALQTALAPLGADRAHVLSIPFGKSDSASAVLINRSNGDADTITRLALETRRGAMRVVNTPGLGRGVGGGNVPMRVSETARLFTDGWTAIVRVDPYRVDWRAPDGRWTLGRPIPVRAVKLNSAEKANYLKGRPGLRNATDWPTDVPPFEDPSTIIAAPEGMLLVKRLPTLVEPGTRYDVINRAGNRRTQIVLSANEHILGFGTNSVYVVATDDDGIQRLRRHPLFTSLRP